ncbi:unnamed protein product [Rotaria socialis]
MWTFANIHDSQLEQFTIVTIGFESFNFGSKFAVRSSSWQELSLNEEYKKENSSTSFTTIGLQTDLFHSFFIVPKRVPNKFDFDTIANFKYKQVSA